MLSRAPTHKRAISWEEGWNLTSGGSCARCRQASKPCCRWQARIAVFLFPSTFLNRHRFFNSASLYNRDLEQKHDTQIAVWSINASSRYSASAKQGHTHGRVFRAAVGNLRIRPADSLQIVVTVRPAQGYYTSWIRHFCYSCIVYLCRTSYEKPHSAIHALYFLFSVFFMNCENQELIWKF